MKFQHGSCWDRLTNYAMATSGKVFGSWLIFLVIFVMFLKRFEIRKSLKITLHVLTGTSLENLKQILTLFMTSPIFWIIMNNLNSRIKLQFLLSWDKIESQTQNLTISKAFKFFSFTLFTDVPLPTFRFQVTDYEVFSLILRNFLSWTFSHSMNQTT